MNEYGPLTVEIGNAGQGMQKQCEKSGLILWAIKNENY